jgi:hypothetical protein
MKYEGFVQRSQNSVTTSCHEPDESSTQLVSMSVKINFNIIYPSAFRLFNVCLRRMFVNITFATKCYLGWLVVTEMRTGSLPCIK